MEEEVIVAKPQLFLLEASIDKLFFTQEQVQEERDVKVSIQFGDIIKFDIFYDQTDEIEELKKTLLEDSNENSITTGKSFLFACDPQVLLEAFEELLLEIELYKGWPSKSVGKTYMYWNDATLEMLRLNTQPQDEPLNFVVLREDISFKNNDGDVSATAEFSIKFSCQGNMIETDIKFVNSRETCLFKDSRSSTPFTCTRCQPWSLWSFEDLTAEHLEQLLCKDPACPAARKLKDFGIGPLAPGKRLRVKKVAPLGCYDLLSSSGKLKRPGVTCCRSKPSERTKSKPVCTGNKSTTLSACISQNCCDCFKNV